MLEDELKNHGKGILRAPSEECGDGLQCGLRYVEFLSILVLGPEKLVEELAQTPMDRVLDMVEDTLQFLALVEPLTSGSARRSGSKRTLNSAQEGRQRRFGLDRGTRMASC